MDLGDSVHRGGVEHRVVWGAGFGGGGAKHGYGAGGKHLGRTESGRTTVGCIYHNSCCSGSGWQWHRCGACYPAQSDKGAAIAAASSA